MTKFNRSSCGGVRQLEFLISDELIFHWPFFDGGSNVSSVVSQCSGLVCEIAAKITHRQVGR